MLASYENILVFRPEKQSILTLFQLEDGIFQLERLLGNWKKIILPNWQLEKNSLEDRYALKLAQPRLRIFLTELAVHGRIFAPLVTIIDP